MIAHSLKAGFFGPAANMHGATYVVDAEFSAPALNEYNVVIDIGLAHEQLRKVLNKLDYQNLDTLPDFQSTYSTTEFLASYIHAALAKNVSGHFQGKLKVTLAESDVAWAAFESDV